MSIPRYTYIISKRLDPVFALGIGISAAVLRIRREEKDKGRTEWSQTWAVLQRRIALYKETWSGEGAKA